MRADSTMTIRRIRRRLAFGFFCVWLAILSAGADHPPPVGFLWLILLDLIAAWLVYLRVAVYVDWSMTGIRFRWFRVFLDSLLGGCRRIAIVARLERTRAAGAFFSSPPKNVHFWTAISYS